MAKSTVIKQENRPKKYKGILPIFFLLSLGLTLLFWNDITDKVINPYIVKHAEQQTKNIPKTKIQSNQKKITSVNKVKKKPGYYENEGIIYDENGIPVSNDPNISYDPKAVTSIGYIPPNSRVNPNYMIGMVYLPSVGVKTAIQEGISNEVLNTSAGTMKPNQRMGRGNYALAGHHMEDESLLFSRIRYSQPGQKVYLTDTNKVYEYLITRTFVVSKQDCYIQYDSEGDKIITLMTCDDLEAKRRFIVRGKLSKIYPLKKASNDIKAAFNHY